MHIFTQCLKNSKFKRVTNLLQKVLLIEFFYSLLLLSYHLPFLLWFNPFKNCCLYSLKQLLSTLFFTQVNVHVSVIDTWVPNRRALLALLIILHALSVDSMSRLNVIFTLSGIIAWSLKLCVISVSICWYLKTKLGMLTFPIFSFSFEKDWVLCTDQGSNSLCKYSFFI